MEYGLHGPWRAVAGTTKSRVIIGSCGIELEGESVHHGQCVTRGGAGIRHGIGLALFD